MFPIPRIVCKFFNRLITVTPYALYRVLQKPDLCDLKLREFKRRIAEAMTQGERKIKAQKLRRENIKQQEAIQKVVDCDSSLHMITPNSFNISNGKLTCYLCSLRSLNRKSKYGCMNCQRGFHVECFTGDSLGSVTY